MASNDKNFVVKRGITIGQGGISPFSLPDVDGSVNQLLKTNGSGVVTWSTLTASDVGAAASSHVHGNITNAGAIGSTTNLVVTTTTSGVLTTSSRSGIDSRSTFPPDSHTHGNITNAGAIGTTTDLVVTTTTSGVLTTSSRSGIDSRASFPAASHVHGNITNAGAIGTTTDLVAVTTTSGVLTTASRSGIDSRSTFPAASHTHPISEVSDATTVGQNVVKLTNPGAITFLRVNANNTVTARSAADFRGDIGAGTSSTVGTVTSVGGTGTVAGITLTGTVTASGNLTLGGTLSTPVSTINDSTTLGQNLVKFANPGAIRFIRINAANTVDALDAAAFRTAIGAGTSSTVGTVTSVAAGNGLTFTTITASGSVTMGTPGTLTTATTNAVTADSHTHAVTFPPATATGGGSDKIFWENDITVTTNYTITTDKNAMSAGPITINDGVIVTVPNGSTWTVV